MVKIRQNLVDINKYDIKCPYEIKPKGITIHNTANNASAENEIAYMRRNNKEVSFHYAIDDIEIVQGILENRNAWHAGDSHGPGNMTTIAIEICYSTGDKDKFEKAQKNAAEFTAAKLKEYGWEIDKIYPHKHWSGKHCPHRTLDDYGWDYFINLVKEFLQPKTAIIEKEETKPFEIGQLVCVAKDAVWANGKKIASWVPTTKMYLRSYKSDTIATISTLQTGAITGTIDIQYLTPYIAVTASKPKFKPYIVRITADRLNVRADAGTKHKVTAIVKKNQLYTIVDEKDGWGKLKSGSGWISLAYTKKVVKK